MCAHRRTVSLVPTKGGKVLSHTYWGIQDHWLSHAATVGYSSVSHDNHMQAIWHKSDWHINIQKQAPESARCVPDPFLLGLTYSILKWKRGWSGEAKYFQVIHDSIIVIILRGCCPPVPPPLPMHTHTRNGHYCTFCFQLL